MTFTQEITVSEYPPPKVLNAYDPEIKQWIMERAAVEQEKRHEWANKEQDHRHKFQMQELSVTARIAHVGQALAALLALCGMIVGGYLLFYDKSLAGFCYFGLGVAFMIGAAIWKKVGSAPESENEKSA